MCHLRDSNRPIKRASAFSAPDRPDLSPSDRLMRLSCFILSRSINFFGHLWGGVTQSIFIYANYIPIQDLIIIIKNI